jgi:hypothetical protein
MAVELEFDLRGEERQVRQRIADVFKRLPASKQKLIVDPERWLENHVEKWKQGKRGGAWFDDYLRKAWAVENQYPELVKGMADAQAARVEELDFFLGSVLKRLQANAETKAAAEGCWIAAVNAMQGGASLGEAGLQLHQQFKALSAQAESNRRQRERDAMAAEAAKAESVRKANDALRKENGLL